MILLPLFLLRAMFPAFVIVPESERLTMTLPWRDTLPSITMPVLYSTQYGDIDIPRMGYDTKKQILLGIDFMSTYDPLRAMLAVKELYVEAPEESILEYYYLEPRDEHNRVVRIAVLMVTDEEEGEGAKSYYLTTYQVKFSLLKPLEIEKESIPHWRSITYKDATEKY